MKKTVLVTGSSGLIGTRFFEQYGDHFNLIPANLTDGVDILKFEATLKHVSERTRGRKLDAVVHLAAFTDVSAAFKQADDETSLCYRLNVLGTENIVKLANYFDSHLVNISTDFVFDGKTDVPITEKSIPNPIEWYGMTKWLAEKSVMTEVGNWTVVRTSFPYMKRRGARPDLVANIVRKLRSGEKIYLFSDQYITPTFGDDIIDAVSRFIDLAPRCELFHVTGPEAVTPHELGLRLAKILGISSAQIIETTLLEYLEKDPRPRQRFLTMDSQKYRNFCRSHDLASPLTIEESLAEAWA